jgi:hypothetical protein
VTAARLLYLAPDSSLLDRRREQARILLALGSHSRLMVLGGPESNVSAFASWMAVDFAVDRKRLLWDFEKAQSYEGVAILRELADGLADSSQFQRELATVDAEFYKSPRTVVSQTVGRGARAGGNQNFSASNTAATLTTYRIDNLDRLACAFFRDLETASEREPILLLITGIRVGFDDPLPSKKLLDILMSSVWRRAEYCAPERICVAIAATYIGQADLRSPGRHLAFELGPIAREDAAHALVEAIDGLSPESALDIVNSHADIGTRSVTYAELQKIAFTFKANQMEPGLLGEAR